MSLSPFSTQTASDFGQMNGRRDQARLDGTKITSRTYECAFDCIIKGKGVYAYRRSINHFFGTTAMVY